jgi:hypothetical protein
MNGMDDAIVVEPVELPSEVLNLAIRTDAGITVLPFAFLNGQGIYSEPSVMLVKELRALGADAVFAQPPEERLFEVKKSAEALLVALVIGIASNASWDLMKQLLQRWREARLSVTYVELEEDNGRRGQAWKAEGDADGVIRAIDTLRGQPPHDPQIGDESTGQR